MSGDEMKGIREALKMSRADFAAAIGFKGNPNTRNKDIFDMEIGKKPIMPVRARNARALFADRELEAHRVTPAQ